MHLARIGPVSLQAPMWNARGPGADWRNMKLKPGKLFMRSYGVRLGNKLGGFGAATTSQGPSVVLQYRYPLNGNIEDM